MFIQPEAARELQQNLISTMNRSLLPHSELYHKRRRHKRN